MNKLMQCVCHKRLKEGDAPLSNFLSSQSPSFIFLHFLTMAHTYHITNHTMQPVTLGLSWQGLSLYNGRDLECTISWQDIRSVQCTGRTCTAVLLREGKKECKLPFRFASKNECKVKR